MDEYVRHRDYVLSTAQVRETYLYALRPSATAAEFDRWLEGMKEEAGLEALIDYAHALKANKSAEIWPASAIHDDIHDWTGTACTDVAK